MRGAAGLLVLFATTASAAPTPWPLFERFVETFVSAEGRVVEPSEGDRTTSEGQAYTMFFALVANDRPLFDRVLAWTNKRLSGDLMAFLPSWWWGKDSYGRWRVRDQASSSDADLWLGYSLLEAGRLWHEPKYDRLGRAVLANVVRREVVDVPKLGPMLLPGPRGFVLGKGVGWRLNPSYSPLQILRRLAALGIPGPWADLPPTTVRMIRATAPAGFAADWVVWNPMNGFVFDPVHGAVGAYEAIRVYLWAAMLDPGEALRAALTTGLAGPLDAVRAGRPMPEKVNVKTGEDTGGTAPPGFNAVLLVSALAASDAEIAASARQALDADLREGLYAAEGDTPRYYDQVLALFALGFVEGRFKFGADGALKPSWESK